ncbi:MAG: ABC transporter ATP-binding protein [Opitutales bacterium]
MAFLELKNVCKGYGPTGPTRSEVLHDINLSVRDGEFVAIVGYSGSGKTTLMSLIAGLLTPDTGTICIEGQPIVGPSHERGLIFQNYSLLPWLSVYGNIALAVNQVFPKWTRAERDQHIRRNIELVNLTPAIDKRPKELSGGMRQRVAVARTLAMDPRLLLLDEPLSALDALTRGTLQTEISRIWESSRKTALLITNSVDEGLLLADRIIPLTLGPRATLGPEFVVDLPRPRERGVLNHDRHYLELRNEITNYLIDLAEDTNAQDDTIIALPNLQPRDPSEKLSHTWY